MNLTGKRVLITGAGHGLGRALAREFAQAGSEVIVSDRDVALVETVVAELRQQGRATAGYAFDVIVPEQIAAVRDQLHAERGPVDVLVNNAGVVFGGRFSEVPVEKHLATIAVNLSGLLAVTHAFLPDLIARPEGRLVNVASASAVLALPLAASYAASKWGVLGFSESLREELRLAGHRHVRVTTICPSFIGTGLFAGAKPARFTTLLNPESVARSVRRAAERGKAFVMLPWTARLLYALTGFLPRPAFAFVCRQLGVSRSMANWTGHAPAPAAYSKPVPES
jgi:short-subunit dehydrogenase